MFFFIYIFFIFIPFSAGQTCSFLSFLQPFFAHVNILTYLPVSLLFIIHSFYFHFSQTSSWTSILFISIFFRLSSNVLLHFSLHLFFSPLFLSLSLYFFSLPHSISLSVIHSITSPLLSNLSAVALFRSRLIGHREQVCGRELRCRRAFGLLCTGVGGVRSTRASVGRRRKSVGSWGEGCRMEDEARRYRWRRLVLYVISMKTQVRFLVVGVK